MVSVKLLILVALFAAVACGSHHRHDHGKIKKVMDDVWEDSGDKKINISTSIVKIFKNLKPSRRVCDSDAQKKLLNPKKPIDMYDVVELLIQLLQGLGEFMDDHVDGLGSLVSRIGIALARISVCKYGSHKFHKKPYICCRNFGEFGVNATSNDVDDVCDSFKVNKAVDQVTACVANFTKQQVEPLYERERVLFQTSWTLAFLLDDRVSLNANTFSKLVIEVSIALGVIGNGLEYSLGDKIAVNLLKTCHPVLVKNGFIGVIDMKGYVKNTVSLSHSPGDPVAPDAEEPDYDEGDDDSDEGDDSDDSGEDESDGQESGNGQNGGPALGE